ncbi:MAG: hypothetical protein GXP49_10555 [Deltaproteobacteria bacterium]|nr:hypothetical protein [Deltaproteobacteria bacterium]
MRQINFFSFRPLIILFGVFVLVFLIPGTTRAQDQDDGAESSSGGGDQGQSQDQGNKEKKKEGKEKQGEGEKKKEQNKDTSYRDRLPPPNESRTIIKVPHSGPRPDALDFHGGIGAFYFGFGAGARYTMNLVGNGFVPSINNSVGLSMGADIMAHPAYACHGWDFSLSLPVTMEWAFYLTRAWTVFAEIGTTVWIRPLGECGGVINKYFDIWFIFGPGARWNITDNSFMVFRLTYPYFSIGYGFSL